jgi:hypothetical protein
MRRGQTRRANPTAWPSLSAHCLCQFVSLCRGGAWCRSCGTRRDRTALHRTRRTRCCCCCCFQFCLLQQWYHSLLRLVLWNVSHGFAGGVPALALALVWLWVWLARPPVWLQRETDSIMVMVMVIVSTCAAGVMPRRLQCLSCFVLSCLVLSRPADARARRTADKQLLHAAAPARDTQCTVLCTFTVYMV